MKKEIIKIIRKLDKENIKYVILRNYDILSGDYQKPKLGDIDVLFNSKQKKELIRLMKKEGYTYSPNEYDPKFGSFKKYSNGGLIGIDGRYGGLLWNNNVYLDEKFVFERRIKQDYFYRLSSEHFLIDLIVHSIVGKRYFKNEYKKEIKNLLGKNLDKRYVLNILSLAFNKKLSIEILSKLEKNDFDFQYKKYLLAYILKNKKRIFNFVQCFLKWIFHFKLKKIAVIKPMVSFIGIDGSGKTSTTKEILNNLNNIGQPTKLIYSGRGNTNLLPIQFFGKRYEKIEKKIKTNNKSVSKKIIIYSLAAPIFALDLFLRYWFFIFPQRFFFKKIVLTDRYSSDLLLMKYVPKWEKKILFSFFPKATKVIYLYNSIKNLHQRRPEHSLEDLKRQELLFRKINKIIKPEYVKTENIKKTSKKIMEMLIKEKIISRV